MIVGDVMSAPVVTVPPEAPAPEVARVMQEHDIGSVVVVDDDGCLLGIVTESDFTGIARSVPFSIRLAPIVVGARPATIAELAHLRELAQKLRARDIMTENVVTAEEGEEVGVVVHRMLTRNLKHIPVVRDGRPVGMVARHDLLKLLAPGPPPTPPSR